MSRVPAEEASPEDDRIHLCGFPTAATESAGERTSRGKGDWEPAGAGSGRGRGWGWAQALAALPLVLLLGLGSAPARAQAFFGAEAVGGTSGEQMVTVTAQTAGTVQSVEVLAMGASGLDFAPGTGTSTCASATLAAAGTCTEFVTFTPAAPGLRSGAVVLIGTGGNVLGTAYLSGTGLGGLGVLVSGNIIPIAGDGDFEGPVGDGLPAVQGLLNHPSSVVLDGAGNIYIADRYHDRIREVSAKTGLISTIAGNGNPSYSGDGQLATDPSVTLNTPWGIALDGAGNVYIADTGNNVIRKITAATGIITTMAGNSTAGYGGDGLAASSAGAEFNQPQGISIDGSGDLYLADTNNHRIRRIDAVTNILTTAAGDGFMSPDGGGGYLGDHGPATAAELNFPFAVAFDSLGNMYIPDSQNNVIREVTAVSGAITVNSVITTFAGTGAAGYSGDEGLGTAATLFAPSGVAVDAANNVYIADTQNAAIRKVMSAASAAPGIISTVARTGVGEYLYDGTLYETNIYGPVGLYLDGSGNLYFADSLNMRVREIQGNLVALDFTKTPVRQGSQSATKDQTIENDGTAALDLSAITALAANNVALNAAQTTCTTGNPFLAVGNDCVIGAVFAPSSSTPPTNPESGTIDVAGVTVNAPLDIQVIGAATAVNSTTVTLTSSLTPSGFGQSVTFTATVTTGATTGNLTGTVSFFDGATTLKANVALGAPGTTATATFTTSVLAVGLHMITATYNIAADPAHFASTSAALTQTVLEATATSLTSSVNPSTVGQNVIFTASVTAPNGGGVMPDGTITFTDGATILGNVVLNAGVATFQTTTLAQGIQAITATYGGDPTNEIQGSTSAALNQDVQAGSVVTVISSGSPSSYGVAVIFTATVVPTGTIMPTGVVNFLDGGVKIGTGNLGGAGQATFTTSLLSVGSHAITAAYLGDGNNGASGSAAITQLVNQMQTTDSVSAAPNPGIAGAPVAITAAVKAVTGTGTITGNVTFTNGTVVLGSAALGAGLTATITPTLAVGQYAIVATYSGDANNSGSVSAAFPLTVQLATTSTVVTSTPNPAQVQSTVTFTAKVTGNGGIPLGSVSFLADGISMGTANLSASGIATFTYAALPAGTHAITASYAGDANNSPSTSPAISQVVGTIPTVTDLGVASTSGANPQVILVATVMGNAGPTPTGIVTFTNGTTVIGSATLDSSGVATLSPNLALGNFSIVASYGGDALHGASSSQASVVSGTAAGFNLAVAPAAVTLVSAASTTVTVTLTSNSGFADSVGLGCATLPPGITCHFSPVSLALTATGTQSSQLTIDTNSPLTGGSASLKAHAGRRDTYLAGLFLPLSLFFGFLFWRFRRRHAGVLATVLVLILSGAAMLATGCGGIGSSSAKAGTYVIQITGTGAASDIIHYQNVTVTITQ